MIFSRRQFRVLAWLCLSALVLTAVAPVVSRVLMPPMTMAADCGPTVGHTASEGHGTPHGAPLDACAYCSLFCHIPLQVGVPPALVLAAPLPPLPPAGPAPLVDTPYSILASHPRGPPQAQA
ncbi:MULTISPECIES: DUF2946 family protein [Oleiagrimonas]|uniref:DUF2946 family protein n=1 Tax=Oleiagrimonas citrea TaxID=1665687 RepID=A0A846ZP94_9GAMM|nr:MULTISPECIES: DUF2946 family protein [Oleiagrimonas]NKZ39339.1 DUF2946 family protein [Oleiagrimonas citrea]RAP59683.1 hypothetical protein BTJ49_03325 [Oleiagrimonas sp. MCCC 1A03011]